MDQNTNQRTQAYLQNIIDEIEPDPQHSNHDSIDYDPSFIVQYKQQEALETNKRKANDDVNKLCKQANDEQDHQLMNAKKTKMDQQPELRLPRKISNDLVKIFEQLPAEQIHVILEKINALNTPDLRLKLDVSRLLPNDLSGFSLNEDVSSSEDDGQKKTSGRKRKRKECRCCSQIVKRHQCKHTTCSKPCSSQFKTQKVKEKECLIGDQL